MTGDLETGQGQRIFNECPACGQLLDVSAHEPYSKIDCPACSESIRIRREFNHFEIHRQIGEGGMSRVFRAEDLTLGREIALKILHRQFSVDAKRAAQFEREAMVTASISHPNVVKVYSVGRDQGRFYIAMELVGAGSFDDLIQVSGRVPERQALDVAIEVGRGLKAAHDAGLIHRDVKPANILFSEAGTPKIVDFGLALMYRSDRDESAEIWATPYYVPPEKLDRGPEDFRSDIYSLGASLFHALAGRPPFEADTASVEALKKLKAKPVSLQRAAEDVTLETCAVIDRALANDPAERFASYDDLIDHLAYARKCLRRGTPGGGARERLRRHRRRIALVTLSAIAAAGAVTAVTLWIGAADGGSGSGGGEAGASDGVDSPQLSPALLEDGTITDAFLQGREALLAGEYAEAFGHFESILADPRVRQPTLNWTRYNSGLALLLLGRGSEAQDRFAAMGAADLSSIDDLSVREVFRAVARLTGGDLPVDPQLAENYAVEGIEAAVLLPLGLKNWELGKPAAAVPFLERFVRAEAPPDAPWIEEYRKLAVPPLQDAELLANLPAASLDGMEFPEARERVAGAQALLDELKLDSPAATRARQVWDSLAATLPGMEEAWRLREAQRMKVLAAAEVEALQDLAREVSKYRDGLRFTAGADAFARSEFQSAVAREQLGDYLFLWRGAADFVSTLISDLVARSYEGEIPRAEGPAVRGTVRSAAADAIVVQTSTGSVTVPIEEMSLSFLLSAGRAGAAEARDPDERRRRLADAVAFAVLTGMDEFALSEGAALAAEWPEFADRWDRITAEL